MNIYWFLYILLFFVILPSFFRNSKIYMSHTLFSIPSTNYKITLKQFLDYIPYSERLLSSKFLTEKWPTLIEILDFAFGRIPKYKYSFKVAVILSGVTTYFAVVESSSLFLYLSYIIFAYLGSLQSKELFDTFWNSTITFLSFYVMYSLLTKAIDFVFVESDWTVVFKNRRLIILGPYFINPVTGHQVWRFWPAFYVFLTIICLGYGTLTEKKQRFIYPYLIFGLSLLLFLVYEADY